MARMARIDSGGNEALLLGFTRSSHWNEVARAHLCKEPNCACCRTGRRRAAVQVHHIFPFHYCVALGRQLAKKANRLTPLDKMTAADKRALKKAMDRRFPRKNRA